MKGSWWRGARGEWYVVAQGALFLVIVLAPGTMGGGPAWPAAVAGAATAAGVLLFAAGVALALAGTVSLGRNLTPLPHPKKDARLVVTGAFRLVRHPIYGGIILMAYGFALFRHAPLTLGYATVLFVFFDVKSRREERLLAAKFPGYADYRRRVRKLIPFLY